MRASRKPISTPAEMRLGFLGDSFVNGYGDEDGLGWVGRVCAGQGRAVTVYNLGIRGDTSRDVARRWRAETDCRAADRLVFSFGVNDCCQGIDAHCPATARELLSQAAAFRPVLMVGPPPIDEAAVNARVDALDEALRTVCADLRIPYVAVFAALHADPVWMSEVAAFDGAHPSGKGYALMARVIGDDETWRRWIFEARTP